MHRKVDKDMKNQTEQWSVGLLNMFRIERDGDTVTQLFTRKQDVLLAILALFRGRPHGREELADMLWPTKSLTPARNRLSEVLYLLNNQAEEAGIPGLVVANRFTMQIDPRIRTDVTRFEELIRSAEAASGSSRAQYVEEATRLYGVGLLPLLENAPWLETERARLGSQLERVRSMPHASGDSPGAGLSLGGISTAPAREAELEPVALRGEGARAWSVGVAAEPTREAPQRLAHDLVTDTWPRWVIGDPVEDLRMRHARQLLVLAEEAEPHLRGVGRRQWMARVASYESEVVAALEWAMQRHDSGLALRIASALEWFWFSGRVDKGRRYLEAGMAMDNVDARILAKAQVVAASLAREAGDLDQALELARAALEAFSKLADSGGIARARKCRANIEYMRGNLDEARIEHAEALRLIRGLRQPELLASHLKDAALIEIESGHYQTAEELLRERLEIATELGDSLQTARSLKTLGTLALHQESTARAQSLFEEALREFQRASELGEIAFCLRSLGCLLHGSDNRESARPLYVGSLEMARALGDGQAEGESLRLLAALEVDLNELAAARDHYTEAVTLLKDAGDSTGLAEAIERLHEVAAQLTVQERRGSHPAAPPSRAIARALVMLYSKTNSRSVTLSPRPTASVGF